MEAPVARKLREGDSVSVTPSLTKMKASPDRLWRGGFGTITFVHGNARHFNVYGADGDCHCEGRRLSPVKKGSLRVGQLVAVMNSFEGLIQILRPLLIYKGVDLRRRSMNLKEIIGMKGEIMGETATVGLFEVVLSNGRSLVLPGSCLIHGDSLPYQPGDAWNPCRVRITSDLDKLRRECEEAPDSWQEDLMALLVGVECIVMQHGTGQNLISVLPDPPHDGRPWVLPMSCVALVSQVQQTAAPVATVSSTTSKKKSARSDRSTRQKQKDAQPESRKEGGDGSVDILGPLVSLPKPTRLPPCASPRPSHSQADPRPNTQDEETHPEGGNELEGVHDGAGRNGFETNDAGGEPLPYMPGPDSHADVQLVRESAMEKEDGSISEEHDERNEDEEMSEAEAADVSKNNTYADKVADPRRMTSGSLHSSTFSEKEGKGDAVSDVQQGDMRECDEGSEGERSEGEGCDQQAARSAECMSPTSKVSHAAQNTFSFAVDRNEMDKEDASIDQEHDDDISDGQDGDVHDSHTYVGSRRFSEEDEYMLEREGSEDEGSDNQSSNSQAECDYGSEQENDDMREGDASGGEDSDHQSSHSRGPRLLTEANCDYDSEEGDDDDMRESRDSEGEASDHQTSYSGGYRSPPMEAKCGSESEEQDDDIHGSDREDDKQSVRSEERMSPTSEEASNASEKSKSHDGAVHSRRTLRGGSAVFADEESGSDGILCKGCGDHFEQEDMHILEQCGHGVCVFCALSSVKEALDMSNAMFQRTSGVGHVCVHEGCTGIIQPGDLYRLRDKSEKMYKSEFDETAVHASMHDIIVNLHADSNDETKRTGRNDKYVGSDGHEAFDSEEVENVSVGSQKSRTNFNVEVGKSDAYDSAGHEKEEAFRSEESESEMEDVAVDGEEVAEYRAKEVLTNDEVSTMIHRLEEAGLIQSAPASHTQENESNTVGHKRDRSPVKDDEDQDEMAPKVPRISMSEQAPQVQRATENSTCSDDSVVSDTQAHTNAAGMSPQNQDTDTHATPHMPSTYRNDKGSVVVRSSMQSTYQCDTGACMHDMDVHTHTHSGDHASEGHMGGGEQQNVHGNDTDVHMLTKEEVEEMVKSLPDALKEKLSTTRNVKKPADVHASQGHMFAPQYMHRKNVTSSWWR